MQKLKKPLAPQEFMAKTNENITPISDSRTPHQSENLACPYDKCGKPFEQPVVLTDLSKTPRETYYACPYCFSKLEIALKSQENLSSVSVKTSDNADVMAPQKMFTLLGIFDNSSKGGFNPRRMLNLSKTHTMHG